VIVILKREITDETIVIPKGSQGLVKGIQWGDKGEKVVVNFTQKNKVLICKDDMSIVSEFVTNERNKSKDDPEITPKNRKVKIVSGYGD
jgi:hypothetical protein